MDTVNSKNEEQKAKAAYLFINWLNQCQMMKEEWVKSVSLKISTRKVIRLKDYAEEPNSLESVLERMRCNDLEGIER